MDVLRYIILPMRRLLIFSEYANKCIANMENSKYLEYDYGSDYYTSIRDKFSDCIKSKRNTTKLYERYIIFNNNYNELEYFLFIKNHDDIRNIYEDKLKFYFGKKQSIGQRCKLYLSF